MQPINFSILVLFMVYYTSGEDPSVKPVSWKARKKEEFVNSRDKHKMTENFVKRLEYSAIRNTKVKDLNFGVVPVDLNLLTNDYIADEFVEGVNTELDLIDTTLGDDTVKLLDQGELPAHTDQRSTSVIYTGTFDQAPEYNEIADLVVRNMKRDMRKRLLDPLYFIIRKKGAISHVNDGVNPLHTLRHETTPSNVTGGGVLRGLLKIRRFGNAESRKEEGVTLVRAHFFIGRINSELQFITPDSVKIANSTLSSLAAHALFAVDDVRKTIKPLDFIIDSPLDYEIRPAGVQNKRFNHLAQTALQRLFRREARMEVRLQRSFVRGAQRRIKDYNVNNKNKNKRKNTGSTREEVEVGALEQLHSDGVKLDRLTETPSKKPIFDDE